MVTYGDNKLSIKEIQGSYEMGWEIYVLNVI